MLQVRNVSGWLDWGRLLRFSSLSVLRTEGRKNTSNCLIKKGMQLIYMVDVTC